MRERQYPKHRICSAEAERGMSDLNCNQVDATKGSVSGKPQSRQSRATASKQEPSEADCPELSEAALIGRAAPDDKENEMSDIKDPLYDEAVALVVTNNDAGLSILQRNLMIGYNRAYGLLEAMAEAGVVSHMDELGSRAVLQQEPNHDH